MELAANNGQKGPNISVTGGTILPTVGEYFTMPTAIFRQVSFTKTGPMVMEHIYKPVARGTRETGRTISKMATELRNYQMAQNMRVLL